MTFDDAFDAAAALATTVTVEGEPKTWAQRLRLAARERFAPDPEKREAATESLREYCRECHSQGRDPDFQTARYIAGQRVGFGPLTWIWVGVMVMQFLVALKQLLGR